MSEPQPTPSPVPASGPSILVLLAIFLAPAVACTLLAVCSRANDAMFPVFLAVMALGSVGCGFWCGSGLATRLVREPGSRIGLGILLGLVCTVASAAACFGGCIGGAILGGK